MSKLTIIRKDGSTKEVEPIQSWRPSLAQDALELCWEIEKLPASEQQTKIIIMASNLYQMLEADEGGKLLDSIEPSEKAKEIGARVRARLLKRLPTHATPDGAFCAHSWSYPPEMCPACNKPVPPNPRRR